MTTHTIGTKDEFPEGRGTEVEIDGISVAVFNIDGDLYGIQNMCPHKRYPLHPTGHPRVESDELEDMGGSYPPHKSEKGRIETDELTVYCPWHFLDFDLESGECDVTGQKVATYDVTETDDGDVVLTI